MDLSQLFSLPYLLDPAPSGDFLFGFVLLGFFLFTTFIGNIMRNAAKNNKHLRKSIKKKLWKFPFLGVIGIILILARFAEMHTFSMRIILVSILLLTILIMLITFTTIYREYSRRTQSALREARKRGKAV